MTANQIAFYPQSSGGGSGASTLIQAQTVSSNVASVTFSNIPQTYTHLKLIWNGATVGNAGDMAEITVNGVSSGYVAQAVTCAPGASPAGTGGFSQSGIAIGGSFGEATFDNYQSAISVQGSGGQDGALGFCTGSGAGGTPPITSITISIHNGTHWVSGVFSLYGLQ